MHSCVVRVGVCCYCQPRGVSTARGIKLLLLVIDQLHEGVASRVYRCRHRLLAAEASVFATEPRTLSTLNYLAFG